MNDLEALLKYDMKAGTSIRLILEYYCALAILSLVLRQAMVLLDHEVMFKQKQITTIMKSLQRVVLLKLRVSFLFFPSLLIFKKSKTKQTWSRRTY